MPFFTLSFWEAVPQGNHVSCIDNSRRRGNRNERDRRCVRDPFLLSYSGGFILHAKDTVEMRIQMTSERLNAANNVSVGLCQVLVVAFQSNTSLYAGEMINRRYVALLLFLASWDLLYHCIKSSKRCIVSINYSF